MKKVLLKAYTVKNLGDDLFIKIICQRYQNQFTIIYNGSTPTSLKKLNNLHISKNVIFRIKRKILKNHTIKNHKEINLKKRNDIYVNIGGSLFIEPKNQNFHNFFCEYIENYIPYYIIGCNFGPYYTNEYKHQVYQKVFKNANEVCFRDSNSYKLFEKYDNIHKASDIIFNLDTSRINMKKSKKVIFSIIDCSKKMEGNYQPIYEQKIIEMIRKFLNLNYQIVLMSFCKKENDEVAIQSIISKLNNEKNKINTYFYNGNIEEAINVLADSSIIIGSRFHANILGLLLRKAIIPIIYSNKTINILNDIGFHGKIIDIRDISNFDTSTLSEHDFTYKCDISKQINEASKQFKELDKILVRRSK